MKHPLPSPVLSPLSQESTPLTTLLAHSKTELKWVTWRPAEMKGDRYHREMREGRDDSLQGCYWNTANAGIYLGATTLIQGGWLQNSLGLDSHAVTKKIMWRMGGLWLFLDQFIPFYSINLILKVIYDRSSGRALTAVDQSFDSAHGITWYCIRCISLKCFSKWFHIGWTDY